MSSGGLAINFSTGNYRMTGPPSRGSIKDKHARSLLTQLDASCVNGSKNTYILIENWSSVPI